MISHFDDLWEFDALCEYVVFVVSRELFANYKKRPTISAAATDVTTYWRTFLAFYMEWSIERWIQRIVDEVITEIEVSSDTTFCFWCN